HDLHAVPAGTLGDQVEPAQRRVVDVDAPLGVGARVRVRAHDFPAIQTVAKISITIPTRKMTRPSAPGPIRPLPRPPRASSESRCRRSALMPPFSCWDSWLSPNPGMSCGPDSIAA